MRRTQTDGGAISDDASSAFILISSRFLVFVITLTVAVIPWSECNTRLDDFPRGQDTEFSLLVSFVILGIILLLVRSGKNRLRSFLGLRYWLLSILPPAVSLIRNGPHPRLLADPHHPPLPSSSLDVYNLPLQI